jgi:hypothetical protein
MLTLDTYEKLRSRLSDYMQPDAYNSRGKAYMICNIYYDTPDNYLIRNSLQKPAYKEKLRLRSYGAATPDKAVYVEIKKKFRGLVNKRRSAIMPDAAERFLKTGLPPSLTEEMNAQVISEARYILSQRQLRPAVYIAYERMAWFGAGQHDLRISFDSSILTRREAFSLPNMLIALGVALVLGLVISFCYIKTHRDKNPAQSFAWTLVILPAVIAIIIFFVGNNIAKAFSLAGVFTIVRFRSVPGDPKDVTYVLFTADLGSLYELQYSITAKTDMDEKAFIDELRCRNGNLNITLVLNAKTGEY